MRTCTIKRRPRHVAIAVLAASAAMGCASGPIHGRLTAPGRAGDAAILHYESSLFGGSGKLWTTLPDGESLKGSYVLRPRDPQAQMIGNLSGARGTTMLCHFRLNEPGVGPDKGGTVRCEVSTGGVFDGRF